MSKGEFIAKYTNSLAGIVSIGAAEFSNCLAKPTGSTEALGKCVASIAATTNAFLARVYDDLAAHPPVASPDPKGTK